MQVIQYLKDAGVNQNELRSAMIQSLSGTAQDLVQSLILDPRSSAKDIFALLDVTFGTIEDSQELLAQYLNLVQDRAECAIFRFSREVVCEVDENP